MKNQKKAIIITASLLLIIAATFFILFIPGVWIGELSDISQDSHVMIRQHTNTKASNGGEMTFEETIADYDLNAQQIGMLKEFLRSSSYTRSLRSTLYNSLTNIDSYNTYDIYFSDKTIDRDNNAVTMYNGFRIGISWGYFSGFKQGGNGWIRINDSDWEEQILQILTLS